MVVLFAGASYVPQFLANSFLAILTKIMSVIDRRDNGEVIDPGSNVAITILILMILQISVYNNYKAKAQLFLRIKASEQQGEQLNDLLVLYTLSKYH